MSLLESNEFIDDIKKKLASPFLFTYAWVFASCNIDNMLFLFYEPLLMSTKIAKLSSQWKLLDPLLLTFLVIIFMPMLNNIAEIIKQSWDQLSKTVINKLNISKFYSKEEYQSLESNFQQLENRYRAIRKDLEELQYKQETLDTSADIEKLDIQEDEQPSVNIVNQMNSLTPAERTIIERLGETTDGKLTCTKSSSEIIILINGVNILEGISSVKNMNSFRSAFESLIVSGYISSESDVIYRFTTKGYDLYDSMNS